MIGVVELQAHLAQRRAVLGLADFERARAEAGPLGAEDEIVFAPRWIAPVGREAFAEVFAADRARAAPADLARFEHALEISAHGQTEPELSGWPVRSQKSVGKLTLRWRDNPTFSKVQDLLFDRVGTERFGVTQGSRDCALQRGSENAGTWGLPTPALRYGCSGGAVGMVVVPDLEYRLRHCLVVPASATPTRVRLADVPFGAQLRFAYGLHTEGERGLQGAPVTLRVLVRAEDTAGGTRDVELGHITHQDGDGWRTFEVATEALRGQVGDLDLEISSPGSKRPFCLSGFVR